MIIIGYEGGLREPKYFSRVEEQLVESRKAFIHPLPPINGESAPIRVLERVKSFVDDSQRGVNIEEKDQVWFVLDVDRYPIEQFEAVHDFCQLDNQRFLAISNPSFEVWLWMHLDTPDKIVSTTSKKLKEELHTKSVELRFGGDYIPLVSSAMEVAQSFDTSSEIIPDKNTTRVYKLLEALLSRE